MSEQQAAAPAADLALHERLLAADPTAPAELFDQYLEPITRAVLGPRLQGPDTHIFEDAVIDALSNYVHRPQQYDPRRRSLHGYLLMSARGDLQNALERERRRRLRAVSLDADPDPVVELTLAARNQSVEDQVLEKMAVTLPNGLSREQALRMIAEEFPEASDRRLLRLSLEGERHTAAFAVVLGITGLPLAEQRRAVKRAKDRVNKRLQRLRQRVQKPHGDTP